MRAKAARSPQEVTEYVKNLNASVHLTLESIKASHDDDLQRVRQLLKRVAGSSQQATSHAGTSPPLTKQEVVGNSSESDSAVPALEESVQQVREHVTRTIQAAGPRIATDFELAKAKEAVDQARRVRSPEEVEKGLRDLTQRMSALTPRRTSPTAQPTMLPEQQVGGKEASPRDLFSIQRGPIDSVSTGGSRSGSPPEGQSPTAR